MEGAGRRCAVAGATEQHLQDVRHPFSKCHWYQRNNKVVEGLLNKRGRNDTEAIYFISATIESVNAFMADFGTKNLYPAAHLYTISPLSDSLFDRIKASPAAAHLRCLKELNLDFHAADPQCFTFENPDSWYTVFNPDAPSLLTFELSHCARRIAAVLITMGEYPYIRHQAKYVMFSTSAPKSICSELAQLVRNELDNHKRDNPNFPPQSQYPRAVLIITDRTLDMLSPLLYDFSYYGMMTDLIGMNNGKFK